MPSGLTQRFLRFFGTNLLGTGIDTFILWLLADFVFSGYASRYILAPAISFECAMLSNYAVSYGWVWSERVQNTPRDFFHRLVGYQLNSLLVFVLKLLLLLAAELLTGFHPILCNLIALTITGLLNFTFQEKLIFREKPPEQQKT